LDISNEARGLPQKYENDQKLHSRGIPIIGKVCIKFKYLLKL